MKRRLRTYFKLVIVLITLACLALIHRHWQQTRYDFESDEIFERDPDLEVRLKPNLRNAKIVMPGRPHPQPFQPESREFKRRIGKRITYYVSTNSLGLRGGELTIEKSKNAYRVICLGDSITFGHGVAAEDCFCALLERRLRKADPSRTYEVINAGVPGYEAKQCLRMLRRDLMRLEPDLLIVCLSTNDNISLPVNFGAGNATMQVGDPAYRAALAAYGDRLQEIVDVARKEGARVAFLIPPINSFFPFPDITNFCTATIKVAHRNREKVIDLRPVFRKIERREGLVLDDRRGVQRLVKYEKGEPRVLLEVAHQARRGQPRLAPEIYAYLDSNPESQALCVDGSHPNERGYVVATDALYAGLRDVIFPSETTDAEPTREERQEPGD